ncbi:hypothetical protein Tco_0020923 [Tanacetum coccineum]
MNKMIAQEVVAKALDDATRQAFEEENMDIASQKRAAQATSTNKLSTVRSYVSTATTPFELEAYSDSDYRGANLDRKSTTEYVAAANCYGQILWIQNQMMDYVFNFMNTKIHIDNESTISVIKNHFAHLRTKHIEIRFHFIRDCYEKRLIEVIKIHTDHNVADILTKRFDVTRFNFLVVSIRLLNL